MIIFYSKPGKESALKLAKKLNVPAMYAPDIPDVGDHVVFNYGTSQLNKGVKSWINHPKSCRVSIDKRLTFSILHKAKVPIVDFALLKEDIPKTWKIVVARPIATGNQGDSLDYYHAGEELPDAELYTEFYKAKWEFRIVVFKGKIAGRYLKVETKGDWVFEPLDPTGFEKIDAECIKAAHYLKLDYVGIDVLAKSQKDFRILETNTAPIITEEVATFIKASVKELV